MERSGDLQRGVEAARAIRSLMREHHGYRRDCINLCAAEAVTSALVREALSSEIGRRYWAESGDYAGGGFVRRIEEIATGLARGLFGTAFANIYPVSGHMALLAALSACCRRAGKVLFVPDRGGGYTVSGFVEQSGLDQRFLPFDQAAWRVPPEEAAASVFEVEPDAVVLGASTCPFRFPVAEVARACRETGARLIFDAAHVLGLIAGGEYQNPIAEGADILVGSTNKTFPGPHRGLVLTDDEALHRRMVELLLPAPYYQSSHHAGTAVALALALAEMAAYGRDLARATVRNARRLAEELRGRGVPLIAAGALPDSHQVVLGFELASPQAVALCSRLEAAGICADVVVRLGTQQVARLGMGDAEMAEIAALVALVHGASGEDDPAIAEARERARTLARSHQRIRYTLPGTESGTAYDYHAIAGAIAGATAGDPVPSKTVGGGHATH